MGESRGIVLVTGGAGYIGSHACKDLAKLGYEPVVFDNLGTGHREAVKWGPLEIGDLLDRDRLADVLNKHRPAAVMHFSAHAYVGESVVDPAVYYRNNVVGSINLLDAMRSAGVSNIVFSSTCATYGVPDQIPIREDAQQNPINPYGRSKFMIERILSDYSEAYGFRVCNLRYFNAAGADPEGEIGEVHEPETHLIPNVLRAGSGQSPEVNIYGQDYDTRDGTCIRDFIHVTDLARAHCLALEHLFEAPGVHAFNLGSETGYSVLEVVEAAEAQIGAGIPRHMAPRRDGDPPVLVADSSLAQHKLGWKREHSSLTEILRTAWQWERRDHTLT